MIGSYKVVVFESGIHVLISTRAQLCHPKQAHLEIQSQLGHLTEVLDVE
jgi:hypothetical protein